MQKGVCGGALDKAGDGRELLYMTFIHDIGPSFCTNKRLRAVFSKLGRFLHPTLLSFTTRTSHVEGIPRYDIEVPLHQWDMNSAPPPTFLPRLLYFWLTFHSRGRGEKGVRSAITKAFAVFLQENHLLALRGKSKYFPILAFMEKQGWRLVDTSFSSHVRR